MTDFTVRRATAADADAIAQVHGDAVRTLGSPHYSSEILAEWGAPRSGQRYRDAIDRGIVFFVATIPTSADRRERIVAFSSYAVEGDMHRIAVYVEGIAARHGVGRAVYTAAESVARSAGAPAIRIEATLGAVPFWNAVGFETLEGTDHVLPSGRIMRCMRMQKSLTVPHAPGSSGNLKA